MPGFGNDKDMAVEYERTFVGMTEVACSLDTLLGTRARVREELPRRLTAKHRQFTALAGWAVGAVKREPFVFELRGLWPDSISKPPCVSWPQPDAAGHTPKRGIQAPPSG